MVNLDPNHAAEVTVKIDGGAMRSATGQILTANAMNAMNTFDKPDVVKPAPFKDFKINRDDATLTLPGKSVVVMEIQ